MTKTVPLPPPAVLRGLDYIQTYVWASAALLRGGGLALTPLMGREVKIALRWIETFLETERG